MKEVYSDEFTQSKALLIPEQTPHRAEESGLHFISTLVTSEPKSQWDFVMSSDRALS